MGISKKMRKKAKNTRKIQTQQLSVRVPQNVLECINLLVDLGLFKDRSDFINYSLQESLKKYLMNIKIEVSPEIIDKYFATLGDVSPKLPEEKALEILKETRQSWRNSELEKNQSSD